MSATIGAILPKGKTQFLDGTGAPLAGGTVGFYIPGTTTLLATYEDQGLTVANANPVILDANGEALIWGFGSYRQIVQDVDGNTIWDEVVGAPNTPVFGVDSGSANSMVISAAGVASFYVGMQMVVIPAATNTGAAVLALNGLAAVGVTIGTTPVPAGGLAAGVAAQMVFDGTNLQLLNSQVPPTANSPGDLKAIAGNTAPAGWDLCYGKVYSRSTNASLFSAIGTLWGAGDGATTFLGPDLRGKAVYGADAMGGTAANVLTSASLGGSTSGTAGVTGGNELVQSHNHAMTVTDPGHTHFSTGGTVNLNGPLIGGVGGGGGGFLTVYAFNPAHTGISVTSADYGTGASQNLAPAAVVNWVMFVG